MTFSFAARLEPLMQKPGWQLASMLTCATLCMAMILYQCVLSGMWQQQNDLEKQIKDMQRVVAHAQVILLQASPLSRLEQTLKENVRAENDILPLDQQFSQPLKTSQATLVQWLPAPGPQGELHLKASFSALMHFLQTLLQKPSHPVFSELNLRAGEDGLAASLLLTQTTEAAEIPDAAATSLPVRDPFASTPSRPCVDEALSPAWRLGGIVQAEGRQSGWLLSPDEGWIKVEAGAQIGMPQWTVEALSASKIELSISDIRCGEQRQTLRFGQPIVTPRKGK